MTSGVRLSLPLHIDARVPKHCTPTNLLPQVSREEGRSKITPLREWELKDGLRVPTTVFLSSEEWFNLIKVGVPTLLATLFITIIVLLDYAFSVSVRTFRETASFAVTYNGMEQGVSIYGFLEDGGTVCGLWIYMFIVLISSVYYKQ